MYQRRRLCKIFSKNCAQISERSVPMIWPSWRSKECSCSMPVWQCLLVRQMVMLVKFGSLSQMLWSRWSMIWRSQLSLSSGDLMPVRKSRWLPTIDIWSLNQLTQVPLSAYRGFFGSQPFQNQSIFERGGTWADWLVKIGEKMPQLATICYIDNGKEFLMLHRNKKPNDVHEGKWIGVGGKLERGETPQECAAQWDFEETGLRAKPVLKGIITFRSLPRFGRYTYVFKVTDFEGRTNRV